MGPRGVAGALGGLSYWLARGKSWPKNLWER